MALVTALQEVFLAATHAVDLRMALLGVLLTVGLAALADGVFEKLETDGDLVIDFGLFQVHVQKRSDARPTWQTQLIFRVTALLLILATATILWFSV